MASDDLTSGVIDDVLDSDVLLNDVDDGLIDATSLAIIENSEATSEGTCSVVAGPVVRFTPVSGFVGEASCIYKVCDDQGACDSGRTVFSYQ